LYLGKFLDKVKYKWEIQTTQAVQGLG